MLDFDSPVLFAIEARDQCVASAGVCSNVAVITSSTWSNRIDGGRPGRGSSTSPPNRLATNRARHLFTVFADTRRSAATCLFDAPGAALTFERLAESLRSQASKLRTAHPSKSVDYEVVVKDGKTMLKPILR